ncbi:MAG: hypothetical protein ABIF09_10955 [Gemmatimonadota bacterium]
MNNTRYSARTTRERGTVVWIMAGVLLMAGCSSPTEISVLKWEGTLAPTPLSIITGRAAAVTQFGRTETSILIEDAEMGTTYGWRIDSGDCQGSGVIQGGPAQYPPLVPGEAGIVSGKTTLSEVFKADGEYAARVFRPGDDGSEEIMACGELHSIQ